MSKKNKLPSQIKVDLPTGAPARTMEQIQSEYGVLASKSGQTSYQLFIFKRELENLNAQMQTLNFEAAALQANKTVTEVQNG